MAQVAFIGVAARALAMGHRALAAASPWLLPAGGLVAGVVFGSCVVPAAAAAFALSDFHDRMDRDAPHRPIGAAVRCIVAGGASMAGSAVLAALTATSALDWWAASARDPVWSLMALLGMYFVSLPRAPAHSIGRGFALALGAATIVATASLASAAECVYAGVVALMLLRSGWRLLHGVACELLQQAQEPR